MRNSLAPLVDVMAKLRSEEGCPWDREQDHQSLKKYLIEEAYEVLDAIDQGDDDALCEELGDVLLQVVFHSQIASETNRFTIDDVIRKITDKLIRRHPHVFADTKAETTEEVLVNWEKIKQQEREEQGLKRRESLLDGIPRSLPALMFAYELQRKAAKIGFDWQDATGPLEKVAEEVEELVHAAQEGDQDRYAEEWGDLFFTLVNAARHAGINPEDALRRSSLKFDNRFRQMEQKAADMGADLQSMTLEEMDRLWDAVKSATQDELRR